MKMRPPYDYEALQLSAEFQQASDVIVKAYMDKLVADLQVRAYLQSHPNFSSAVKSAFEFGFVSGASFIKDNPDL